MCYTHGYSPPLCSGPAGCERVSSLENCTCLCVFVHSFVSARLYYFYLNKCTLYGTQSMWIVCVQWHLPALRPMWSLMWTITIPRFEHTHTRAHSWWYSEYVFYTYIYVVWNCVRITMCARIICWQVNNTQKRFNVINAFFCITTRDTWSTFILTAFVQSCVQTLKRNHTNWSYFLCDLIVFRVNYII